MRFCTIVWLTLTGFVCAGPALALTISNLDPKPHTVTVTAGGKSEKLTVESGKEAEAACAGGCTVKLNGDTYQLKGNEAVSIEDSAIFIDSSPDAFVEGLPDIDPDTVPDEPVEEEDVDDEDLEDTDQTE